MKRILFLCDVSLQNPNRGTPLRIYNFLRQIKKEHELIICCTDVPEDLTANWVAYPKGGVWEKLHAVQQIVRDAKTEVIFTTTETGIVLPILLKLTCRGPRLAIDLHGVAAEELHLQNGLPAWKKWVYDKKIKLFLRFYDHLFVISERLKAYYAMLSAPITVVYGGVDPTEFFPLPRSASVFTIGYMGNARKYQGLPYLFAAAQRLKEANAFPFRLHLIISNDEAAVRAMLGEHDLHAITDITFGIEHGRMREEMAAADVLVIPRPQTRVNDLVYPSKLPECLALGRPVIVTDVGPMPELAALGCPFVMVSADDLVSSLVRALTELAGQPPEARDLLGQKGFDFVKTHLAWDVLGRLINERLASL